LVAIVIVFMAISGLAKFRFLWPLLSRSLPFLNTGLMENDDSEAVFTGLFIALGKTKGGSMAPWKESCALPLLGLLLLSTAGCGGSLKGSPEAKTAFHAPEPTILRDKIVVVPSLDARVTKLAFFSSSASDVAPLKNPTYGNRFAHAATNRVYPEIQLEHPRPGKRVYFTMTVHIRENKKIFRIVDYETRIEPDWTSSYHSVGVGILGPGNWRPGSYEADVYINGEKVAAGYFEVY
jgi:hypothetical protein